MKTQFEQGQIEAINTMIFDVKGRINVYKNIGVENDPEAIVNYPSFNESLLQ